MALRWKDPAVRYWLVATPILALLWVFHFQIAQWVVRFSRTPVMLTSPAQLPAMGMHLWWAGCGFLVAGAIAAVLHPKPTRALAWRRSEDVIEYVAFTFAGLVLGGLYFERMPDFVTMGTILCTLAIVIYVDRVRTVRATDSAALPPDLPRET